MRLKNRSLVCSSQGRDGAAKTSRLRPAEWSGLWGQALIEKRSVCSNETGYLPERQVPIRRILIVPILYQDEVIGHLAVANKATDYSESDQGLVERLANYLAPVLNLQAELLLESERKALEDSEGACNPWPWCRSNCTAVTTRAGGRHGERCLIYSST